MKNIGLIFISMWAMVACSKSEIDMWEAKPRVWFTAERDTMVFSFYSQPADVMEYTLELPISMAGMVSETDRTIEVKDLGASHQETVYEIVGAMIPAGKTEGVLQIKVKKTANLNTMNDTIGFELCPSEIFELGLTEGYWHNAIVVSNSLTKPVWWTDAATDALGYYSDKKMEVIYAVEGVLEVFESVDAWYDQPAQVAIYKLNRYCKENNIKYHPDDADVIKFAWGSI